MGQEWTAIEWEKDIDGREYRINHIVRWFTASRPGSGFLQNAASGDIFFRTFGEASDACVRDAHAAKAGPENIDANGAEVVL